MVLSAMRCPYQVVAPLKPSGLSENSNGYLVTASGPILSTTSLDSGKSSVQWLLDEPATTESDAVAEDENEEERPKKKQKTSNGVNDSKPNIIKLAVSEDQNYLVAVTDDKLVRVFRTSSDGSLNELSSRAMPKRPCAIQILPDNSTILCGDKFGDVYSLPLLVPTTSADQNTNPTETLETPPPEAKPSFKPSATNLTVHSVRNRKTLQAQIAQKNLTPRKEALKFEHQLLLGHVSMLTDLLYTKVDQRGYIITADRDEHIRISRAAPQSHVIEGYCLGHTEYISRIRLVAGTELLVSAGGDDWVGVWEWGKGRLVTKIDLKGVAGVDKVDVSGLWIVPTRDGREKVVVVAIEKVKALFVLPASGLRDDGVSFERIEMSAPIVDAVSIGHSFVVSLDERDDGNTRLSALKFKSEDEEARHTADEELQGKLQYLNSSEAKTGNLQEKQLDDLLYGIANLRKRVANDEAAPTEED